MLGSNFGQDTGYPDLSTSLFSSNPPCRFYDSAPIITRPFPSIFFPIHYPSIVLSFDTIYPRYWKRRKWHKRDAWHGKMRFVMYSYVWTNTLRKISLLFKSRNAVMSTFPYAKHPLFFMGVCVAFWLERTGNITIVWKQNAPENTGPKKGNVQCYILSNYTITIYWDVMLWRLVPHCFMLKPV